MAIYVLGLKRSRRRNFTKLRISSHHLAVETGRYTIPVTPPSQRLCKSCNSGVVGDEKLFLLHFPKFAAEKKQMFNELSEFLFIQNMGDFKTFVPLMQYYGGDLEAGKIICSFVDKCLAHT